MSNLKAGFCRLDITPPLGVSVQGYFELRLADGILDPLLATAVAFDNGEKRIVVMSLDLIGFNQTLMDRVRKEIAKAIDTQPEAVFVACTHTHLGPGTVDSLGNTSNPEYIEWLVLKLRDAAVMAVNDLKPAELSFTRGKVEKVAFVRRFRMKDGTVCTNPGYLNPNIDKELSEPDENSSLLIIKRQNEPQIGIVNFQVHPDVIGGCTLSADYPKFVRDTYEKLIDNSVCMYINGAQGDTNHIDVRLPENACRSGYDRARYMGRKIAMSVLENYELAEPLDGDEIFYGQKNIMVQYNKADAELLEKATRLYKRYKEEGSSVLKPYEKEAGTNCMAIMGGLERVVALKDFPDNKELYITAVSVGGVAFAGFPGEPFTQIGRSVKENSPFQLTVTACFANGYEGYYPVQAAFDEGGYEAASARYKAGTAEKIIDASSELLKSFQ